MGLIKDESDSPAKTANQACQQDGKAPATSGKNKVPIEKSSRTNDVILNMEGKINNQKTRNTNSSTGTIINKIISTENELSGTYGDKMTNKYR